MSIATPSLHTYYLRAPRSGARSLALSLSLFACASVLCPVSVPRLVVTRDDRLAGAPLLLLGGPIVSQNPFSPHDAAAVVGPLLGSDRLPEGPGTLLLQGEQVPMPVTLLLLLASAVPLSFPFWAIGSGPGGVRRAPVEFGAIFLFR